jgi:hypothetical protein
MREEEIDSWGHQACRRRGLALEDRDDTWVLRVRG